MPPCHVKVSSIRFTSRFEKDLASFDVAMKKEILNAIKLLKENPASLRLRLEKLSGIRNPSIYTIHVTSNHSHKISFELNGQEAILRRVATHKIIDRTP